MIDISSFPSRLVRYMGGVSFNDALYVNECLKDYVGENVLIQSSKRRKNKIKIRNMNGRFICIAEKSSIFLNQKDITHQEGKNE